MLRLYRVHLCIKCAFVCSDTDVHTVASLLKLYLRELPEPVVPWTQYQDFLDCTNMLDTNSTTVCVIMSTSVRHWITGVWVLNYFSFQGWEKFEKQIALLPRFNYNLLSYVCRWVTALCSNNGHVLTWDQSSLMCQTVPTVSPCSAGFCLRCSSIPVWIRWMWRTWLPWWGSTCSNLR